MTREEWENGFRKDWMSDDQFECYKFLADIHNGFHHMFGKVHNWGTGIKLNSTCSNHLATFDYNNLTRLVVLAHDKMIRVEIVPSGPNMIGIVCHKRKSREGRMYERHPTIEDAIKTIRKN